MVDRIDAPWGERTAFQRGASWPVRVDLHLEDGLQEWDVELVETDWETALGAVVERSKRLLAEAEINWWMVRQGAMAARDTELAELFERCHEETWNQLKWAKTKIKEASPQTLVAG